jgi:hypothetical protein
MQNRVGYLNAEANALGRCGLIVATFRRLAWPLGDLHKTTKSGILSNLIDPTLRARIRPFAIALVIAVH